MPLLELRGVSKHFGGLAAVSDLSFEVNQGELIGLIGPNGAGKTTVFNIVTGSYLPTKGQVVFDGQDISRLSPDRTAKRGVVRTWQLNTLFSHFNVMENIEIGCHLHSKLTLWPALFRTGFNRRRERILAERAWKILEFMDLIEYVDVEASSLAHGLQRMLGVAIALAAEPRLLLLDEPLTGMNHTEVEVMLEKIRQIRDQLGATIVVVEHNMEGVMALCERLVVMSFGQKIAEGSPEEIAVNEKVIEAYLGSKKYATKNR